jgi:16S rRNA (cytosine1402-N4)-methyltransferase
MSVAHIPVLLEEVTENLVSVADNLFVDTTVGGGGHSSFLLERYPGLNVVGLDVDEDNLKIAEERLRGFEGRVTLIRGNFRNLKALLKGAGIASFDGILFDLGLSTYQIAGTRGFSFHDESFLDMRMDAREPLTAYDVVNKYNYEALKRVIFEFGEEYRAARIARVIVEERKKKPIATAKELARVVEKAKRRTGRIHPATKTFQAIRIEVNHELESLRFGLMDAIEMLRPAGRIGVISFHSLEDRIVKEMFKTSPSLNIVMKKPMKPRRAEVISNPSARSAKLRIAERI